MDGADVAAVEAVRDHYDRVSVFYRTLWGEHIHHGFWLGDESTARAQLQLVERLAQKAQIARGAEVLDVGCGLGGSARWLAATLGCDVLGITISPEQAWMATDAAHKEGLADRLEFRVHDAHQLDLLERSFDAIWILECSEHLFDRKGFFASCASRLRPGGVLAMCAWLRGKSTPTAHPLLLRICHGMLCPVLSTMSEYGHYLESAGFALTCAQDVTANVRRTWTQVERLVRLPWVQLMLRTMDRRTRDFVAACQLMGQSYDQGVMAYGMLTARLDDAP